MSAPGKTALRDNKGKDELSYLLDLPKANAALAHVFRQGAKKYSRGNWQLGGKPDTEYLDAALRHITKHVNEGVFDHETGALHLAHAIWNLAALIELNVAPVYDVFLTENKLDQDAEKKQRAVLVYPDPQRDPGRRAPFAEGDLVVSRVNLLDYPVGTRFRVEEALSETVVVRAVWSGSDRAHRFWWSRFMLEADWEASQQ